MHLGIFSGAFFMQIFISGGIYVIRKFKKVRLMSSHTAKMRYA